MNKNLYWPKRTKFKKFQKLNYRLKGLATGLYLYRHMNGFILKTLTSIKLKTNQLESARRILRRLLKRQSILYLFLNCDQSITKKSNGIRMGKGKGVIDTWVAPINAGRLLFFLSQVNYLQSIYSLNKAKKKFSFRTRIIVNNYKNINFY